MRCGALACFGESVRSHEERLPAFAHTNPVRERRPTAPVSGYGRNFALLSWLWAQDCARYGLRVGAVDITLNRGRKRLSPSPPSEPAVQFSRDGLSSQLFPHRD